MKISGDLGDTSVMDFFALVFQYSPSWRKMMEDALEADSIRH